jgi:hypothetical protein
MRSHLSPRAADDVTERGALEPAAVGLKLPDGMDMHAST